MKRLAILCVMTLLAATVGAATFDTTFKFGATTRLSGSGWGASMKIQVFKVGPGGIETPLGFVRSDASGEFDVHWVNTYSGAAAIKTGDTLVARKVSNPSISGASTVQIGSFWDRFSAELGSNIGPLENMIIDAGLTDAGFIGSIDLTDTSAETSIVSSSSVFDSALDTVTTTGVYDFSNTTDEVLGIYTIEGTFSSLVDHETGDPIVGLTSFEVPNPIGSVIPTPGVAGILVLGAAHLLRRESRRATSFNRAPRPAQLVRARARP